ncbi:glutathione peroxidase [Pikeienuella piscinae]
MRSNMISAVIGACALILTALAAVAAPDFTFRAIEGGEIDLATYRGGPVLVVNTASRCGYTYQYAGLQELYDAYREQGFTIVAVPSDAFNQELASNAAVKDFCAVNYGLTIPMTEVTKVTGSEAHPFYAWLLSAHDFEPQWNFNKVLLDANGDFVAGWRSSTKPMSAEITGAVERLLPGN